MAEITEKVVSDLVLVDESLLHCLNQYRFNHGKGVNSSTTALSWTALLLYWFLKCIFSYFMSHSVKKLKILLSKLVQRLEHPTI